MILFTLSPETSKAIYGNRSQKGDCLLGEGGELPRRMGIIYILVRAMVTGEYTYFSKLIKLCLNPVRLIVSYTSFSLKRKK